MTDPVVAAKEPFEKVIKAGERYAWCSCGLSKQQPVCAAGIEVAGRNGAPHPQYPLVGEQERQDLRQDEDALPGHHPVHLAQWQNQQNIYCDGNSDTSQKERLRLAGRRAPVGKNEGQRHSNRQQRNDDRGSGLWGHAEILHPVPRADNQLQRAPVMPTTIAKGKAP